MNKAEKVEEIRVIAESYFRSGKLFCSEAVVKTVNEVLGNPYGDDVIKLASGFPVGIGKSGCLCGAVSGGVMALGMAYGRLYGEDMPDDMFKYAAALHDHIKNMYKSTCCRVMTRNFEFASEERKCHCIKITGEVAAFIAGILIDDNKISLE